MSRRSTSGLAFLIEERPVEAFEQLDSLLRIVTVRQRVVLGLVLFALAGAAVFSCLYEAPLKVEGRGIILSKLSGEGDPLLQVTAPAAGRFTRVEVRIGETVRHGAVIARLDQSEQFDDILAAEADLLRLQSEDARLREFEDFEARSKTQALGALESTLLESLRVDGARMESHRLILRANRKLSQQQFLPDLDRIKAQSDADAVSSAMGTTQAKLGEVEYDRVVDQTTRQKEQLKRRLAIQAAETNLILQYEKYARDTQVISQYEGKVVDLTATPHALIEKGAPAALLRPTRVDETPGEAIVYVPAGLGKKVDPDDLVEVSPDTTRRQEHGFIWGEVESISEIPATEMAMIADLKHRTLVASFLEQYAGQVLLSIRVKLRHRKVGAANVLDWSSSSGTRQRVGNGTLCAASVVVERRPLITLAIPWLKHLFGLD
ncbi:MAG: NHLP bacteriocin system secretion protein [Isosphaeraceae bacterium]